MSGTCSFTACAGKECGEDGCGGSCGSCSAGQTCEAGECVWEDVLTPGFVQVFKGSFWMGTPDGTCPEGYPGSCTSELGRLMDETSHYVQLTRDFEMQAREITQAEWKAMFSGTNPSDFSSCGDDCPVENVTWFSVLEYANQVSLSKGYPSCYQLTDCSSGMAAAGTLDGCEVTVKGSDGSPYNCTGYRLPTEAEWEYAYRAGSTTAFYPSGGNEGNATEQNCRPLDPSLDMIGWYCGNSYSASSTFDCSLLYTGATTCGTQPVGGKAPNAWGLYDMSGNVWEWVWDWKAAYPTGTVSSPNVDPLGAPWSSGLVSRGGGWYGGARDCRAGERGFSESGSRFNYLGARVARTLAP